MLKLFLHISREEQRKRLLERLRDPKKRWKFALNDLASRDRWGDYQRAYGEMISHTSTKEAPWWIMPADRKWLMRTLVAQVISNSIRGLDLRYPLVDDAQRALIAT